MSEIVTFDGRDWVEGAPDGQRRQVHLTVSEATVLIGMKRTRIRLDAERAVETDEDRRLLRILTYPDVCAAVTACDGMAWPPDFETFLTLPDGLLARIEQAIYKLNPHWLPRGDKQDDPKAPAPASTSG